MNGPEMMLKMLGVDPSQIGDAMKQFQDTIALFNTKMDMIAQNQQLLYQLMVDKGLIDTVDVYQSKLKAVEHVNGNC